MPARALRIAVLVGCLLVAAVAGLLALDPLLIHGFAPACSDGYAEANGTAPCRPEWGNAAPYLMVLAVALAGTVASAVSLAFAKPQLTYVWIHEQSPPSYGRVIRWRRSAGKTWEARVMYLEAHSSTGPERVEKWCDRGRITPAPPPQARVFT